MKTTDFYKDMAVQVFKKPYNQITEEERTSVKRAFFKYLYTSYPKELENAYTS